MILERSTYCYYDSLGYRHCNYSGWSGWGRWVLLGILIAVFLLFIFLSVCFSRRRARRGARPIYGTGWAVPNSYYNNNAPPPSYPAANQDVPPYGSGQQYAPPQQQYAYQSPGYQQELGVTQPKPAYKGDQYAPPAGPPPGHHQV